MNIEKEKPMVREKALKFGMDYPMDEELVMLILGSGNKDASVESLSKKIISALDSAKDGEVISSLLKVKGIGIGKALAVAAGLELGKRRSCHLGAHISHPEDLLPFVKNYAICQKEHFLAITLNGGHDIIQIHVISVGTINRTIIHPREIFNEAIKENAAAVILCHNHPSGRTNPSNEDIETTKNLIQAAEIVGIPILDHIIIDKENYYSFMEHHLLFSTEK